MKAKRKSLFFFSSEKRKYPLKYIERRGNFDQCFQHENISTLWNSRPMRAQQCRSSTTGYLPLSHPRVELGRTPTSPHRRWWLSRPRNSGSISFSQISGLPRQTAWSWGFWMRSEPPQCPWSWPWSSGCPAPWAGSPWRPGGPGRPGNWEENVFMFFVLTKTLNLQSLGMY